MDDCNCRKKKSRPQSEENELELDRIELIEEDDIVNVLVIDDDEENIMDASFDSAELWL